MSMLRHVDIDMETRDAYLRLANARRRAAGEAVEGGDAETVEAGTLPSEEFDRLAALEEFILTVTAQGYGKRTSAFEYRTANRGGLGIANIETSPRNGLVVASFPVENSDQIMLVTDGGKLIRLPVHDIRIAGRKTQGVTLLRTAEDEHVVSAARLPDMGGNGEEGGSSDDDPQGPEDERDSNDA
jgi:DNA gyrase subunit A